MLFDAPRSFQLWLQQLWSPLQFDLCHQYDSYTYYYYYPDYCLFACACVCVCDGAHRQKQKSNEII